MNDLTVPIKVDTRGTRCRKSILNEKIEVFTRKIRVVEQLEIGMFPSGGISY